MRIRNVSDPVYAPNSKGGPRADSEHFKPPSWYVDGEIMRSAYVSHAEDDDWGQAGTVVREVLDDAARDRLVSNVTGLGDPSGGRRGRHAAAVPVPAPPPDDHRQPG